MRLSEIAEKLGLKQEGPDIEITGVGTLESAGPGDITFLANPKYASLLESTKAGAVLVSPAHAGGGASRLVSENVYMDLARIISLFAKPQGCLSEQSPLAFVHESARVDETATLYPFAFIGAESVVGPGARIFPGAYVGERCRVGAGCTLFPGAVLMADTELGRNVCVFAGAVLGADGFGYAQTGTAHMKIPQIGRTIIEDDVEIGANSSVDRAALDTTVVGQGTKLDNLVQVGHNVHIGKHCIFASGVGIGGSTRFGDEVMVGGQAGFHDNISIGSGARVGGGAGVQNSLAPGAVVSGYLAMDYKDFLKVNARMPQVPELFKRVRKLEKELARLTETLVRGQDNDD